MAKLRTTWNGVLPLEMLAALDSAVRTVNPSWQAAPPPAVHVNPRFIPVRIEVLHFLRGMHRVDELLNFDGILPTCQLVTTFDMLSVLFE